MTSNKLQSKKRLSLAESVDNSDESIVYNNNYSDHESSCNTQIKSTDELKEEIIVSAETDVSAQKCVRDSLDVTSNQSFNSFSASSKQTREAIKQGEEEMAEVDTTMLAMQHGDIRREGAEHASEIRYDVATRAGDIRNEAAEHAYGIRGDVKDTRHDVINEIDRQADRLDGQATAFYVAGQTNANIAARDLATLTALTEANAVAMRQEIALNVEKVGAASALQAEKIGTAVALGQANLARDIFYDGQKTRDLINDLKYHDLNRSLIERNSELVEERNWGKHWYTNANQAQFGQQFAQLQTQMQNFNSQLAETRQGMVNFGTMAGVGQTSTSNNVR